MQVKFPALLLGLFMFIVIKFSNEVLSGENNLTKIIPGYCVIR
jgi:hypothetical protein